MNFAQTLFDRFMADWSGFTHDLVKSLIRVKAQTILPLINDIDLNKAQRVKLGIDPTGSDIHIGHLAPLFILDIFARIGHHVDFIIGDFTTKIGDPSGRVAERKILNDAEIEKNYATYKNQVSRYFDTSRWTTRRNSEWLSKVSLADVIAITQHRNMATIMQREDFRIRMESGGLTQAETLYGMLQGLDSVNLGTTVELGGIDQLLNIQQARELQRIHNQSPQVIICNPLLLGTDGQKMSKSYNNYIALNESAENKFGKLMSISDDVIEQYWKTFGYLFEDELKDLQKLIKTQPLEAKKQLATYLVAIEHGMDAGLKQRAGFEKKFAKRELTDDDYIELKAKKGERLIDVLMRSGKFKSKSDLKRIGIDPEAIVSNGVKLRVGKLNFFHIVV